MSKKNIAIEETYTLALQNHKKNNLKLAEKLYKEILNIDPNHFQSIFLLGTLSVQTKNLDVAKKLLKKAIQINSNHAAAHNNLGNVLIELKEYQKAVNCCQKATEIQPDYADANNNLGVALKELGDFKKARICFEKATIIDPNHAHAYNNLGVIFRKFQEFQKAKICFEKSIKIQSYYIDAHNNLGNVLKDLGDFQKAINCYKKAIKIQPSYINAHHNLMEVYEKTNQEEKLKNAILNARSLVKDNPVIKLYEGILLNRKDKFKEAINILESISFKTQEIKNEKLRASILAKCYDRIGNIDKAFDYFIKANILASQIKSVKNFDKNRYLQEIKIRKDFFVKSEIKKWSVLKLNDVKKFNPVFLVGFPRSGTTLLDIILRSHPSIEVFEEKPMVNKLIGSLNELPDGELKGLEKINIQQLEKIRKTYYESLESQIKNKNTSKVYIDKLPLNIIHTGQIVRVFPNAKFIVSLRHPYDCVLSCFMQDFDLNDAMANFLNLDDSAHLYDVVMDLWIQYTSIFEINYHEVKYENLVESFEPTVKSVLNFLGLPWDVSIFQYFETAKKRTLISTPSYSQVIKPLYSHASGRWKQYKKQISNIYPILEKWTKKFNY